VRIWQVLGRKNGLGGALEGLTRSRFSNLREFSDSFKAKFGSAPVHRPRPFVERLALSDP
jgi:hypothetical protein